ncbi:helix-turn-helix domain-containing protein [Streptomyces cinereoruber]|uniref:helix-turn-helix domain-containing protein n=1 Tax=Streptomyces cinereoruber TaxID=67260 RepID=UPI00362D44CB
MSTEPPQPQPEASLPEDGYTFPLERRPRRTGDKRVELREAVAKKYVEDTTSSIRSLAEEFDASFGLIRNLLLEAKVELRSGRRRKAAGK